MSIDRQRTFGILAHIDAGKTTLADRILFDTGARPRLGQVDDGTAATDWLRQEQERGISITAATAHAIWRGVDLQVVDLPGHVDFSAEVERVLEVVDATVVVVDGTRGVESQTVTLWHLAERLRLPRVLFVNKLDRVGYDYDASLRAVTERFSVVVAPLVVPLADERGAIGGIGNALTGAVQWFAGEPNERQRAAMVDAVRRANAALVEICAGCDDEVLEDFVEGRPVGEVRLRAALRKAASAGALVPALAGSALRNVGVTWLLDAVVDLLPDFEERVVPLLPAPGPEQRFLGRVFKIQHVDGSVLAFLRSASGELRVGDLVWASGRSTPFAAAPLCQLVGGVSRAVTAVRPGQIVVIEGDHGLRTGDVVVRDGPAPPRVVGEFSRPVLTVTFEPATAADVPALRAALAEQLTDDPTLSVDPQVGDGPISVMGLGELHLEIVADRLRERTGCRFRVSSPAVATMTSVAGTGVGRAEVRADGGAFAVVEVEVAPALELAPTLCFAPGLPADDAVREALVIRMRNGFDGGGPVGRVSVVVRAIAVGGQAEGPMRAQAAEMALQRAGRAASLVTLEPSIHFEVVCPEEFRFGVVADLNSREATITQVASGVLGTRVEGHGSLRRFLGYATRLRSITKGHGRVLLTPGRMIDVAAPES
ncbi:MAG: GTP-binding protein [Planctomycetes bacterium]|nr:GTP-binding protein [Planctomycetota bacterium]